MSSFCSLYPWILLSLLPFSIRAEGHLKNRTVAEKISKVKFQGFFPFVPMARFPSWKMLTGVEQGVNRHLYYRDFGFLEDVKQFAEKLRGSCGLAVHLTRRTHVGLLKTLSKHGRPDGLCFFQLCPKNRLFSFAFSFCHGPNENDFKILTLSYAFKIPIPKFPQFPLAFVFNGSLPSEGSIRTNKIGCFPYMTDHLSFYFNLSDRWSCFLRQEAITPPSGQVTSKGVCILNLEKSWAFGFDFSHKAREAQICMEPGWLPMQAAFLFSQARAFYIGGLV